MLSINPQPVPTRTISPSSESSDNSGHAEYYPDTGRQGRNKEEKKKSLGSFSSGSIPVESWQTYADLAGMMDAISNIQTQEMFISKAKEELDRMKSFNGKTENPELTTLSTTFLNLLSRANLSCDVADSTNTHGNSTNHLKYKGLEFNNSVGIDWQETFSVLNEHQTHLATKRQHLLSQAKEARRNIEKFNKTGELTRPHFNETEIDHMTLADLIGANESSVETQTIHLPKRVAQLINN